ncbi:PH domain-containing protein [Microbacterium sp. NPDC096154]|uniref:PH domain-containing protein n=1 Tax=Microbacterium sp. NPDC096154 TaxID=3155549 RepID=UPI0033273BCC
MTPSPETPGTDPAAGEPAAGTAHPVLDRHTYTSLREPRAAGRLALDGAWHQISPKYVVSQTVQNAILIAIALAIALVLSLGMEQHWVWIPAGILIVTTLIAQVVLPRQARALGYMLRDDDLVFRKGILWQRMIAVPYGRLQLVDITQGPMDRAFGIAKLKMVTAAATTGVEVPGLSREAAEALRDTLIDVAETRRTGL